MIALLLFACAPVQQPSTSTCEDAPYADYASFGDGFVVENCQVCHASTVMGEDRIGAPEDVTFDDAASVWAHARRVLDRAGVEPPTMPPEGGTTESDRALLRAWLECSEEGE